MCLDSFSHTHTHPPHRTALSIAPVRSRDIITRTFIASHHALREIIRRCVCVCVCARIHLDRRCKGRVFRFTRRRFFGLEPTSQRFRGIADKTDNDYRNETVFPGAFTNIILRA